MDSCRLFAVVLAGLLTFSAGLVQGVEPNLQNAKAWFDKGMLYREAGDPRSTDAFKQAAADLDVFIAAQGKSSPDPARAYTLRARCRNLLGDNEQAIRDLDRAIELSPADGNLYFLRSFIYETMGNAQLSLADLRTAAQKGNEKARGELKAKGRTW